MVHKPQTFFGETPELKLEDKIVKTRDGLTETRVAGTLATSYGVDASEINVVASGDTVHLSGFVTGEDQIARAVELAEAVDGVEHVISHIEITSAGRG